MSYTVGIALEISAAPFDQGEDEEKPFACNVCDRRFSGLGFLKAHFQRTHPKSTFPLTRKTELSLRPANSIFSRRRRSELSRHSILSAKEDSSHMCQTCKKTFSKKTDLMKHEFVHRALPFVADGSGIRSCSCLCVTCSKTFISKKTFKDHTLVKCELCSRFHCSDWLYTKKACNEECQMCKRELCENCHNLHQSTVIVEKSHECVICNKVFSSKKSVKDHYTISHSLSRVSY